MRKLLIAALAASVTAPAAAQVYDRPSDEAIVRNLPRPGEIEAVGETLEHVTDALMDVDIGPLVDAVDPSRTLIRRHRGVTLGDIASRDDPYARERMRDSIEATTIGIGAIVDQLAVLTPVLRRSIEDSRRRIEDAMHDRRLRAMDREYDRDFPYPDDERDR